MASTPRGCSRIRATWRTSPARAAVLFATPFAFGRIGEASLQIKVIAGPISLFETIQIPFESLEHLELMPPTLASLRLHLQRFRLRGMKLDFPDFEQHILLDKSTGIVRQILFTPDNSAEFKGRADEAIAASAPATPPPDLLAGAISTPIRVTREEKTSDL